MAIDIRAEVRAIDKAMARMLAKAQAAGVKKPSLYFEAEGSIYIMDDDHDGQIHADGLSSGDRQKAVVADGKLSTPHDVGAW
jgi:tRNA A-37 threonylcarbamoyl transferase component Bud32